MLKLADEGSSVSLGEDNEETFPLVKQVFGVVLVVLVAMGPAAATALAHINHEAIPLTEPEPVVEPADPPTEMTIPMTTPEAETTESEEPSRHVEPENNMSKTAEMKEEMPHEGSNPEGRYQRQNPGSDGYAVAAGITMAAFALFGLSLWKL